MKRILLLVIIAGITFLVILFARKPELISDIWIWLIGLSGLIVKGFQYIIEYFKDLFNPAPKPGANENTETEAKPRDLFSGTSLKLLRISDDGKTTIGLLFVNNRFYCYTLEDARREVKIPGETRIPAGTYLITFRKELSELTQKYRDLYPDWFSFHLQLNNVPEFDLVYLHNGGDHTDTEGCILVSDSIQVQNKNTMLTNSRITFRRLYEFISEQLSGGTACRIIIQDENWINDLKPST
ncbi:MAG: hypothetical protein A2W90_04725 [Bacteroidetes bacterium GWF2_42_66]|nr:MAG: hypothetical protein A2W92_10865 [Bacteroidetes bacterium GWA2_42_15]OFY00769.1 MAG: hypothetical protein A2W89_20945 [Bacteroidetes bacterium GWE2_42_39]OFY40794.1 MAG: hypothetical protein A2W90_04725 [Bacteroidetes bacterium GWF2_42_66]HBL75809.1 hypothetical protein [Prolixibacteraceae bacterium]HCR91581.1 hypothetical protein [Prolixibacteraceae bacterium]